MRAALTAGVDFEPASCYVERFRSAGYLNAFMSVHRELATAGMPLPLTPAVNNHAIPPPYDVRLGDEPCLLPVIMHDLISGQASFQPGSFLQRLVVYTPNPNHRNRV